VNDLPELHVFYGGTFDPIHDGHLAIARAARAALDVDVHVLPAADPPHRAPPGAVAADRAAMVRLAIAGSPGLLIDTRELQRGGRSWSVDTLHALRGEFGKTSPIAWLVGADSFRGLPSWKCWRELFGLTHFVVAARPGSSLDERLDPELADVVNGRWTSDPDALRHAPAGRVLRLEQSLKAHSATDLRGRIAAGLPWRHLVPAAVADYIVEHRLYGFTGQAPHGRVSTGAPL
jgi:nicotinate-nucleotide adenylyltransferase